MGSIPGFYLTHAMNADEQPNVVAGGSGYFSAPNAGLDPHLFNGTVLKHDVRASILKTLYDFWGKRYSRPLAWSRVWLAGSGVSYQWSADRGNGDLDVLIGVDFAKFFEANPTYQGVPEPDMADLFNQEFHADLWPATAETNYHGQVYEETFYVNPNSTDIRDINPYAAYDVSSDTWTIKPPQLPQDPRSLYPKAFWDAADSEERQANDLIGRYRTLKAQADSLPIGSPGHANALAAQALVVGQAKALYDSIHLGRKNAFGPGGSGYGDYYNFRWQVSKDRGYGPALDNIEHIGNDADEHQAINLYGAPIKTAEQALSEAALWNSPYRRSV